eukprot:2420554-Rhodomonas_salina.1
MAPAPPAALPAAAARPGMLAACGPAQSSVAALQVRAKGQCLHALDRARSWAGSGMGRGRGGA